MQHKFRVDDQQVITECVEAARNIALCVQHQKSIVDDILTISKLDSNLLLITPTPTQPAVAVQRVMSMFYPECQAKGIEFCFKPHVSLERYNIDWVLLDPTRLSQITVNLITNAIKFTQHSPKRSILVHLSASLDHPEMYKCFEYVPTRGSPVDVTSAEEWGSGQLLYLHVDVEDTGCGLTAEEKALLFEKFAQASPRTHAHYGGSGLGLFISRRLTELHGGQIGVSSEAGFGSTFSFFLQCKRFVSNSCHPALLNQHSNISQSTEHDDSSNSIVVATESEPDFSTTKVDILSPSYPDQLHILIVEDNLLNQRVLAKQLIRAGSVISTANNGLFALEHLTKSSFYTSNTNGLPLSIILMDWEMPDMDGLTCCKKIREMEKSGELNAHVPILGVTANVRPEQVATAKESGMDDLLSKPFRVHQLLDKIREVLGRLNVDGDFGRTGC
jgi:CheY-like chemotaxis protein